MNYLNEEPLKNQPKIQKRRKAMVPDDPNSIVNNMQLVHFGISAQDAGMIIVDAIIKMRGIEYTFVGPLQLVKQSGQEDNKEQGPTLVTLPKLED